MKMTRVVWSDLIKSYASDKNKHLLYLSPHAEQGEDVLGVLKQDVLWFEDWLESLDEEEKSRSEGHIYIGEAIIFEFDTQEEAYEKYSKVRGDDGLPPDYKRGRVYAMTVCPKRGILTENT